MGAESLWEPHTPVRPPPPPPTPPPLAPPPSRKRWFRRPLAVVSLALGLLLATGVSLMYVASERLGDNVTRVQAFDGLDDANRPPVTDALTFLLVGTDSRSETTAPGVAADGSHSDAEVVMVAHVAPDRKSATVVSIPRDSWVDIPDHGQGRVSGAYAAGGPALLIRTVEHLTDQRIDHFAVIDFAGFRSMVDALGGIDVDIQPPLSDTVPGFHRGTNHLDGALALVYVRDRTGLANGDRGARQQNALRAMLDKAATNDTLTDPVRLYDFLDAASHSMGVDDTLSNGGMRALAFVLGDLRSNDVLFTRAPVMALGRDGGGVLVQLDQDRGPALWTAVQQEKASSYVQQNARDALGPVTR